MQTCTVGKYILGKTIGRGKFSKVKEGEHTENRQKYAVKILRLNDIDGDKKILNDIQKEINVMRKLKHINVMGLQEVMVTDSNVYLVMELIDGGDLYERIVEKGKLAEESARRYFHHLIDGVEYIHSETVFHRDLKPENLLIKREGDILKISDFGLSALLNDPHTMLRTPCGTPHYLAPEVLSGKPYEGRMADVWSCGIILYAMVTGCHPFDGENLSQLIRNVCTLNYAFPRGLSKEVKDLIKKILVLDPKKRGTISDIRKDPWFKAGVKESVAHLTVTISSSNSSPNTPEFLNPLSPTIVAQVSSSSATSTSPLPIPANSGSNSSISPSSPNSKPKGITVVSDSPSANTNMPTSNPGTPTPGTPDKRRFSLSSFFNRKRRASDVTLVSPVPTPGQSPRGDRDRLSTPIPVSSPEPYAAYIDVNNNNNAIPSGPASPVATPEPAGEHTPGGHSRTTSIDDGGNRADELPPRRRSSILEGLTNFVSKLRRLAVNDDSRIIVPAKLEALEYLRSRYLQENPAVLEQQQQQHQNIINSSSTDDQPPSRKGSTSSNNSTSSSSPTTAITTVKILMEYITKEMNSLQEPNCKCSEAKPKTPTEIKLMISGVAVSIRIEFDSKTKLISHLRVKYLKGSFKLFKEAIKEKIRQKLIQILYGGTDINPLPSPRGNPSHGSISTASPQPGARKSANMTGVNVMTGNGNHRHSASLGQPPEDVAEFSVSQSMPQGSHLI